MVLGVTISLCRQLKHLIVEVKWIAHGVHWKFASLWYCLVQDFLMRLTGISLMALRGFRCRPALGNWLLIQPGLERAVQVA